MIAHQIENGVVVNTIEVENLDILPNLIEATEGSIGWTWDGTKLSPPVVVIPIPQSVSPRQIRQALTRANLRQSVEAAIASGDQDTKDWYEYATEFVRTNPHVIAMGLSLNVSEQQLDDLWRLAGSL